MKAIMYHYVRQGQEDLPWFRYLHAEDFRAQLDHFQEHYRIVGRDDFMAAIDTGTPVENGIVLTFDDGVIDHLLVTEELVSRGLWGLFYVSTGPYKKRKLLDVHRVHMLLGRFGGERIREYLLDNLEGDPLSGDDADKFRRSTYTHQVNDQATLDCKRILNYYILYEKRTPLLDAMVAEFFGDEAALFADFYLSRTQIRQIHDAGMTIGSHSISHRVFSRLPVEEQEQEIHQSFSFLEDITGDQSYRNFCYPHGGRHNYTADTVRILEETGCRFSFDVDPRDITAADILNEPHSLPRYDCNQFPHGLSCQGMLRPHEI